MVVFAMKAFILVLVFVTIIFVSQIIVIHSTKTIETDSREILTTRLLSTAFAGDNSAWLVTLPERNLLYTDDEGQHWHAIPSKTVGGFGPINFISKSHGWMLGQRGIWKTWNGGKHWELIAELKPHNDTGFIKGHLQFINELHGWIIEAPNHLWQTVDGGKTWRTFSLPERGFNVDALCFYIMDSMNRWIGCGKGIVLITNDGGKNWKDARVSNNASVYGLTLVNPETGWALVGNSLYKTIDRGISWQQQLRFEEPFESPMALSLYFLNEKSGWVVGHSNMWAGGGTMPVRIKGVVLQTGDGGGRWNYVDVKIREEVFSEIHFIDPRRGWLISRDNVYRTSDGGQSWRNVLQIPQTK
jgi:photosystem II stability/assembly factor-like uncharacterized protein